MCHIGIEPPDPWATINNVSASEANGKITEEISPMSEPISVGSNAISNKVV